MRCGVVCSARRRTDVRHRGSRRPKHESWAQSWVRTGWNLEVHPSTPQINRRALPQGRPQGITGFGLASSCLGEMALFQGPCSWRWAVTIN